jgi:hypothetical protein
MIAKLSYFFLVGLLAHWVMKPSKRMSKLLILRASPGVELEQWLKRFHWGQKGQLASKISLPRYKFYSEVIDKLLELARQMGGNYQEALLFLREGLLADLQFEKKLKESQRAVWLQMLLMLLLTWIFIICALNMVQISPPMVALVLIASWQGIGLILLPLILRWLRERLFGDIGKLWKMLYILSSLYRLPLARSAIFGLAEIKNLREIQQKNLLHLVQKLADVCERALKQGSSYEVEVKMLMDELRFQEKWHFELLEKRLSALKLGLLSVFFLPSYLAFIFVLMKDLTAGM